MTASTAPSVTLVRLFDRSWTAWVRGVDACRHKPGRRRVHALRIECRRLQALLHLLAYTTKAPAASLRRLDKAAAATIDVLSSLRDDQIQRRRVAEAADSRGMEALLDHLHRREARHRLRARAALARLARRAPDAAATRVRKAVVRRQGAPTPGERTRLLLSAADAIATDLRSRLARLDTTRPKSMHRLRIALKRFRYATELAEEISPNVHAASQATLRALQRRLGLIHDAGALIARIDRFVGRRRTHREDVRAFRARVDADCTRHLRGLTRSLPALRRGLTDLAARASTGAAARAS